MSIQKAITFCFLLTIIPHLCRGECTCEPEDEGHDKGEALKYKLITIFSTTDSELLTNSVISQVLELGIIVHSVIIGIALGVSESPSTIKPLVAALCFHHLGGYIMQVLIFFCTTGALSYCPVTSNTLKWKNNMQYGNVWIFIY